METPEDKAKKLIERFIYFAEEHNDIGNEHDDTLNGNAKQCALIAVEEILRVHLRPMGEGMFIAIMNSDTDFWQSVKTSLESM